MQPVIVTLNDDGPFYLCWVGMDGDPTKTTPKGHVAAIASTDVGPAVTAGTSLIRLRVQSEFNEFIASFNG